MHGRPFRKDVLAAALATGLIPSAAHAVSLNPDGLGQALIYPYYTVRTAPGGNAFNTYLSVVNTNTVGKAVRVILREGRAARPVLDFNLYLSPNDVWTGAVVPSSDGARLLTTDTSCTDPAFATGSGPASLDLSSSAYTGSNADGFGDSLDRTREGYVEMIEMATLTGVSAAAVTPGPAFNCAAIRATSTPSVAAPTGGLTGTLTLINVNSGQDFGLDATALADLSTRPYFRPAGSPGPDFDSDGIEPVSLVVEHGHVYRSVWGRPVDAVSAVLMRASWLGEYVLDNATGSLTDMVVTLPTRQHYVTSTSASPPFRGPASCRAAGGTAISGQGEALRIEYFNREEATSVVVGSDSGLPPVSPRNLVCAAAGVATVRNRATHIPADATRTAVFGSTTHGLGPIDIHVAFQNGWIAMSVTQSAQPPPPLVSQSASTRIDIGTGQATPGPHTFFGLPMLGFTARTFANGTLTCGAGSCQGNYGSAFAFRYRSGLVPPQ